MTKKMLAFPLVLAIVLLVLLLVMARLVRGLGRVLFGRRKRPVVDSDQGFCENLAECPLPIRKVWRL